MEVTFITGVVIITAYLALSIRRFGIPPSISDTYYLWAGAYKNVLAQSAFSLAIMATAICIAPLWINLSTVYTQWLAFIGAGTLALVGAACAFEETLTHKVHYTSAFVWAGASVAWSLIHSGLVPVVMGIVAAFIGLGVQRFRNKTFWLEVGAIVALLAAIILRYYDIEV